HRDPFCCSHRSSQRRTTGGWIAYAAQKRTFELSQKRTLQLSRYIFDVDNWGYVKFIWMPNYVSSTESRA
ncbi:hypothetical protein, partial [Burkholderia sp. Ac-20353]|uniref:hypothetical protein n=1 Tax=Burkholderia sp. Ac-20353 TaxID=2703894 RepID=UPI00197BC357